MNLKVNLILALFAMICLTACGGDDEGEDCNDTLTQVALASTTFSQDESTANCEAYKDAYANHIIDCPRNPMFEAELDSLNCLCFDPLLALQGAQSNYDNDPSTENCASFRAAIQDVLITPGGCDPQGILEDLLDDLNC